MSRTISPEDLASRRTSLGKRARSPSVSGSVKLIPILDTKSSQAHETFQRQPKRQRKSKLIPDWDAPPDAVVLQGMGKSNPLNRHVLKKDRKRERKLARNRDKDKVSATSMEVDDTDASLASTFMA